jgi:hypothetical protein
MWRLGRMGPTRVAGCLSFPVFEYLDHLFILNEWHLISIFGCLREYNFSTQLHCREDYFNRELRLSSVEQ